MDKQEQIEEMAIIKCECDANDKFNCTSVKKTKERLS